MDAYFEQSIQIATAKDIGDGDTSSAQWIEKEEELAHGRANIELVEGLLQLLQLMHRWNQLVNVIFEILELRRIFVSRRALQEKNVAYRFSKVSLTDAVVQGEAHARMMIPHLAHGVLIKIEYTDTSVWIVLVQIGEDCLWKEAPASR